MILHISTLNNGGHSIDIDIDMNSNFFEFIDKLNSVNRYIWYDFRFTTFIYMGKVLNFLPHEPISNYLNDNDSLKIIPIRHTKNFGDYPDNYKISVIKAFLNNRLPDVFNPSYSKNNKVECPRAGGGNIELKSYELMCINFFFSDCIKNYIGFKHDMDYLIANNELSSEEINRVKLFVNNILDKKLLESEIRNTFDVTYINQTDVNNLNGIPAIDVLINVIMDAIDICKTQINNGNNMVKFYSYFNEKLVLDTFNITFKELNYESKYLKYKMKYMNLKKLTI